MKRVIFASLLLAALLTSCFDNGQENNQRIVYALVSMESKTEGVTAPVKSEYLYTDPSNPKSTQVEVFNAWPKLTLETITGDTLSHISYSYGKNTLTARRHTTDGRVIEDSLAIGAEHMASEVLSKDQPAKPYYITYTSLGGRESVGDLRLSIDNSRYVSTTKDGQMVAQYYYTTAPNFISLQQFSIPGAPYYWATDSFGRQSKFLLDRSVVREEGVDVTYKFNYNFDINGFVRQETILRQNRPFKTNMYNYAKFLLNLSTSESKNIE